MRWPSKISYGGAALVTAIAIAGCSSSSGVHTQDPTSSPPSSSSSTPSSPAPSSTSSPSSSTSSTSAVAIPTPTVTVPAAQPAVAAYAAFQNALYAALSDPAHADLAALNRYLSPAAQKTYDGSIHQQATSGHVWRGTPPTPRIKIVSATGSTVFMTNCPLPGHGQLYDSSGRPVPVPKPAVPEPWLETLTMTKVGGQWTLTMENADRGKTCSP